MDNFHQTRMGQDYYLGYVPRITKALETLANAATNTPEKVVSQPTIHPHIIDSWDTSENPESHLSDNYLPCDEAWQKALVLAKLQRGWNAAQ